MPGESSLLDSTIYTTGTSNAAALASRSAAFLFETLNQAREDASRPIPKDFDVVLVKALLVHSTYWAKTGKLYKSILNDEKDITLINEYSAQFLGNGPANMGSVMSCTHQRVTILGFGHITDKDAEEFRFPLPPSLANKHRRRRLKITLAWLTPINSKSQKYRAAHLWFESTNKKIAKTRTCPTSHAVKRGTVQHEVFDGQRATGYQVGDFISIKVNCRIQDQRFLKEPIRYGLAVTLESPESTDVSIYQEVRQQLQPRIPKKKGKTINPLPNPI